MLYAMTFLFVLVLLRLILRKQWLAAVLWCALIAGPFRPDYPALEWISGGLRAVLLLIVLTRGGLLALAASLFFMFSCFEAPFTLDLSAWYASRALPAVFTYAGLAVYAFHTSLAGKPLFGRSILED